MSGPSNRTPVANVVNSTPQSQGTSSYMEEECPEVDEIKPYIRHDIQEDKRDVDLDLFMKNVLSAKCAPSSSDDPDDLDTIAIKKIAASASFTDLLDKYKAQPLHETHLYPKFTQLCHNAIQQLVDEGRTNNELGFVVCVQHPNTVCGSSANRKPDTVGTSVNAIEARIRHSMGMKRRYARTPYENERETNKQVVIEDHIVRNLPEGDRLSWDDLFTFVEFKKEKDDEEKGKANETPQVLPSNPTSVAGPSKLSKNHTSDVHANPQVRSRVGKTSRTSRSSGGSGLGRSKASDTSSKRSGGGSGRGPSKASSTSSKRPRGPEGYASLPASKKSRSMTSESKPESGPKEAPDIWTQCAGYAHLLFNRGGIRTHVIGVLVTHKYMQLLLYTRSRGCSTKAFNFVEDPERFLRILLAFTRLDFSQWGFCDELIPRTLSIPQVPLTGAQRDPDMFDGRTITLGKEQYDVRNIRLFPRGLIGRGTWTLTVERSGNNTGSKSEKSQLILKISSPPSTRRLEEDFIKRAVEKAIEEDKARETDNTHSSMLNHLPNLIASGALSSDRDSLFQDFQELLGYDYEKRSLRYLVVEELHPITDLTDCKALRDAFKDIIKCHRWLVEEVKILHRDISVNNLMYRKKGDKIYGVLNDYDLSAIIEVDRVPTSKQRTGTKPFIAMDLLSGNGRVHLVRYDLESTVYVFAWIVCRYENKKEIANPPFEDWCYGNFRTVKEKKNNWLHSARTPLTSRYKALTLVLVKLRETLRRGIQEKLQYDDLKDTDPTSAEQIDFDEKTLNGHVTYDTILAAFDSRLPQPPLPPPPPYVESPASLL